MNNKRLLTLAICSTLTASASFAASTELQALQTSWAKCQYNTSDKDQKEQCLNEVVQKNTEYLDAHPNDPELTVWLAINKSTLAGAKGGLGALSLVKEAKTLLESVIDRAPQTLDGSAYTSLGSLYYQVPGWPLGFGNDKTAEQMLKKALEINPNGIDPNYFYADFLAQDGRKEEAKQYFNRALQAPSRPDRPLADQGRKMEIQAKLKELS